MRRRLGVFVMLEQKRLTPMWVDDTVQRQGGRKWMGRWVMIGLPHQKYIVRKEEGAGRVKK